MDFNGYIQPLASIGADLRTRLLDYGLTLPSQPGVKSYFSAKVNQGFLSTSLPQSYEASPSCVQEAVDLLQPFFSRAQYTSCEVNVLDPSCTIREHTDQSSAVSETGINEHFGTLVSQYHSVHVPLTGTGLYGFRRDPNAVHTYLWMPQGFSYWYNNYVMHNVKNIGPDSRVNMVLHFHDPKWSSKKAIYTALGLRGMY